MMKKRNLEMIIRVLLFILSISIGIYSQDVKFTDTTVGELEGLSTYELFEALKQLTGTAVDDVDIPLWCAVQCSEKNFCYFYAEIEERCVLCFMPDTNDDSALQAYNASRLPHPTQIHYKHEIKLEKVYEIVRGSTSMTYDAATTACTNMGMTLVTFASVQEYQTLIQQLLATEPNGAYFKIGLAKQPDNTWMFGDGGAEIPELWYGSEPNGNGPCVDIRIGYYNNKLIDSNCGGANYICQRWSLS